MRIFENLKKTDEWECLRVAAPHAEGMQADALLLSIPCTAGPRDDGRSAEARKATAGAEPVAGKYGVQLVYFSQYENDPTFFADNLDHPGERGLDPLQQGS